MAKYVYKAKSSPQQIINGEIEANSIQEAVNYLTKLGYFPISVKPADALQGKQKIFIPLKHQLRKELVFFTREFLILLKSGLTVLNSLTIISKQTKNKYFKSVLEKIISNIKEGRSLSESLAEHKDIFPTFYTALVNSGEISGSLEAVFEHLANFLEREQEFKNSIQNAFIYPIFIIIAGLITILILMVFIVPKILVIFEEMNQILPLPTRILIGFSNFLKTYWWLVLFVFFVTFFLIRRISQLPSQRLVLDKLKLKIFFFGKITLKTEIARLTKTLSLLLSGGIGVLQAIEISCSVIENQLIKSELQKIIDNIRSGASFAKSIQKLNIFPDFSTSIIEIGEETATLDSALLKIAEYYEKQIEQSLKTFARLLEPSIILIIGVFVGFIVIALLLPIFQINLLAQ